MSADVFLPITSSMICNCGEKMAITKDACGRDRLRCPTCDGVAAARRHPDDAMIPQGLVKANGAVRIVREFVHVPAPAPEAHEHTGLPYIRAGQLRCQICARGVRGNIRFCARCLSVGQTTVQAIRMARAEAKGRGESPFSPKVCDWKDCDVEFIPTGPAAKYCEAHR